MEPEPKGADAKPPERKPGGPLRLCCTCAVIAGLVVGLGAGYLYLSYRRAFDPERASAALAEKLAIAPPPGYQAAFDGGPLGMTAVLIGPEGVDLRTPVPSGTLRMMLGVMPVDRTKSGETVQKELVEFFSNHPNFKLRAQETREVPVVVRGKPHTAVEVIGVVSQGGAPCKLVSVVVDKDAADPHGPQVLVGALGPRDGFDQAAWNAFLASIK